MIMELVDGFTPGFELPEPFLSEPALRYDLGMAYVDGCADLSRSTGAAAGSTGSASPRASSNARFHAGWHSSTATARATCRSSTSCVSWLDRQHATDEPSRDHPRRLQPVQRDGRTGSPCTPCGHLDWDTGTIGDPLLDIGHLLARWTEPGERPVLTPQAGDNEGYPTRRRDGDIATPSAPDATSARWPITRRWRCSSSR